MSNNELKQIAQETAERHLRMVRKSNGQSLMILDLKVGNVNVSYDAKTRVYTVRALAKIETNTKTGMSRIIEGGQQYVVATAKAVKNWLADNYIIEVVEA